MRFIKSRGKSFGYAGHGIWVLVRTQSNAWVHLAATLVVIGLGIWLQLERTEWLWLTAAIGIVWVAEGFNTALELMCDALHPERHAVIGKAKDTAAGAVLIAALTALVIGVILFWPHVFN